MGFPPPFGYFRNVGTGVSCGRLQSELMRSERILVVDDEDSIREIVSSMLVSANYQCRQAASGLEALALRDSGAGFALMLSDLIMAVMEGIGRLRNTYERYPD